VKFQGVEGKRNHADSMESSELVRFSRPMSIGVVIMCFALLGPNLAAYRSIGHDRIFDPS
jgi:hypothetical protein